MKLTGLANFLLGEIQCAKMDRFIRAQEIADRSLQAQKAIISVRKLTRAWEIEESPPFKKVALHRLVLNFHPSPKRYKFQNFAALYRFILMRLTDPSQRIQEYSVRLHGKSGRANSLLGFPPELENLLLDFGEDLIGYSQNELKEGAVVNPSNSSFFMGLGNTHKERQLALEKRTDERIVFRSELFRALQLALRDVRSYEYDVRTSRWRANDRKAKRTTLVNGDVLALDSHPSTCTQDMESDSQEYSLN
ncbi:hypothetical protein Y032_0089g2209 [Ancylostoma ceylanicum]|uniref:Uncharacterized protein n=1 Tax=Ancylostoma ceylanicum TaxID=53326 RepID=A0A016TN73_9BILA|nr:hypothetical protein Y032_0089g2209 [Ancylostoma ceylanicum]